MSDILIIDKDLRTITIPDEVTLLGVESDDDVYRLNFQMPKTYGEYDLSTFSARINYVNANAEGDVYVVDDMAVDGDNVTFTWLVGRNACEYKGYTKFNVCLKKMDENSVVVQEFNTQPVSLPVLEGLETTEAVIQENPDIIEYLLNLLSNIDPSQIDLTDYVVKATYTEIESSSSSLKTIQIHQKVNGSDSVFSIDYKLYKVTGSNTDGSMTQKAITDAFNTVLYLPVLNQPTAPSIDYTSITLLPNVFNVLNGTWLGINVSLSGAISNVLNRYYLRFSTGSTPPTLTMPSSVKIPSFTIEANKTYDIIIHNNIAYVWCDGAAIGNGSGGGTDVIINGERLVFL